MKYKQLINKTSTELRPIVFAYAYVENYGPQGERAYLDVGGGTGIQARPHYYSHLRHVRLDIDPKVCPDRCMDARLLRWQEPNQYEAIYCSHNLEHYDPDDIPVVLQGFCHVLKEDGFAEIKVPNISRIADIMIHSQAELADFFYQTKQGPVFFRDPFYGFAQEIASSGQFFYAHKMGFSPKSLREVLLKNGFCMVVIECPLIEIRALAFKNPPTEYHQKLLNFSVG